MKIIKYLCGILLLVLIICLPFKLKSQIDFNPDDNFYDITSYWDHYYDSLSNVMTDEELMEYGYKFYNVWKDKWEPLVQPNGEFGNYFNSLSGIYDCIDNIDYWDIQGSWEEIGPLTSSSFGTNEVGRLSCIEVDQRNDNLVLAGSPVGGLYYTENYGVTWINAGLDRPYIDHGLPMLTPGISSILISLYNDKNYWIVATGDKDHSFNYTDGILRTTDKGNNWVLVNGTGDNSLPDPSNNYYIRKIVEHPSNPNNVFAVTSWGVYETNNIFEPIPEDVIWTQDPELADPEGNDEGFFDLEFHKTNPDIRILSREYRKSHLIVGDEVMMTINGGQDWNSLSGVANILPVGETFDYFLVLMELTKANPDIMYLYFKGTKKDENGDTEYYNDIQKYEFSSEAWTQLSPLPYESGNGRNGFAVSPVNANHLFCSTIDTYKSTNGGMTWSKDNANFTIDNFEKKYPHSDVQDLKFNNADSYEDQVLWAASDGGPYYRVFPTIPTDGSWHNVVNNIGIAYILQHDQYSYDPNYYLFGGFDVGAQLHNRSNSKWNQRGGGDGYGCVFDDDEYGTFYTTNSWQIFRYKNFSEELWTGFGQYWNRHVIINPGYNNIVYTTCGDSLGRSFDQGETWEPMLILSDINNFVKSQYHIYDVHVAPSDPDILYVRFIKRKNGVYSFLLKTTNANESNPADINWQSPLYPYEDADCWLSDVAIDESDPNHFWSIYSGYDKSRIWEYDGNQWTDISNNLSTTCLKNVSSIIHLRGTENGLFVLARLGVYYKPDGEEEWYLYKPGLPHTNPSNMDANYCSNKLIIGTQGRGIWQTDLPNITTEDIEISQNTTWEGQKYINGIVTVPYGKLLTIKGTVKLSSVSKIVVERGGRLLLDGGRLTNSCYGETWKGVEVWGNPNLAHTVGNQGVIWMRNGAIIENAEVGIRTAKVVVDPTEGVVIDEHYSGGIVQVMASTIKNNANGVIFYKYPSTGYTYQSNSFFTNTEFIVDNSYSLDPEFEYFVRLYQTNRVKFNYSNFINETDEDYFGGGIYCFDSQIYTEGYSYSGEWDFGLFQNLEYGIYALGAGSNRFIDIRHTEFDNNFRGVFIHKVNNSWITSNFFRVYLPWEENGGSGLYLDNTIGFKVEDNNFERGGQGIIGLGLLVKDCGISPNEIYSNHFTLLQCGIEVMGENRREDGSTGLELLCNTYNGTDNDAVIYWPEGNELTTRAGLAVDQGSHSQYPQPEEMAGNLFYKPDEPIGDNDDMDNMANDYIYRYPQNFPIEYSDVVPEDYTTETITPDEVNIPGENWIYENGCPSSEELIGGGGGSEELKSTMVSAEENISSMESILSVLIDGGNTEVLQTEVQTSVPPETMQLYNELMGESPYLSDTVVSTAIVKEDVLPNAMIRDIMVANPHTAKSNELMSKLDERFEPLPDYMKAQILQGKSIVSIKEELESELAGYRRERSKVFNALSRWFVNDSIYPIVSSDSLVAIYQQDNRIRSKYDLALLHIQRGEAETGLGVLNNIPSQFDLQGEKLSDHQAMVDYCAILANLSENGKSFLEMDSLQMAQLFSLVEAEQGMASVYARSVLLYLNKMDYTEPVMLPDLLKSAQAAQDYNELLQTEAPKQMELYPNPSDDYVIVSYKLEIEKPGCTIRITDLNGVTMQTLQLNDQQDQVIIDTQKWKPGIYISTLELKGNPIESIKFTIL